MQSFEREDGKLSSRGRERDSNGGYSLILCNFRGKPTPSPNPLGDAEEGEGGQVHEGGGPSRDAGVQFHRHDK